MSPAPVRELPPGSPPQVPSSLSSGPTSSKEHRHVRRHLFCDRLPRDPFAR